VSGNNTDPIVSGSRNIGYGWSMRIKYYYFGKGYYNLKAKGNEISFNFVTTRTKTVWVALKHYNQCSGSGLIESGSGLSSEFRYRTYPIESGLGSTFHNTEFVTNQENLGLENLKTQFLRNGGDICNCI
jgi:hypothetical protein